MTATTDRWLTELLSWVGIVEDPRGSNRTPVGARFGWNGVAWCCEEQSVVLLDTFGRKILWTAGVADAIERARRGENGLQLLGPTAVVQVGDLPTYDFGGRGDPANFHIEGVINPGTQTKFETVGGNVGDACRRQWRDRRYVTHFIRPPYEAGSTGLGSPPEEDDMAKYDEDRDKILAALALLPDLSAAVGRLDATVNDKDTGLKARLDVLEGSVGTELDKHLGEVRRNIRRVGAAVKATDIEGTA